jgi:DNA-binding beta-propeller fold protein YncE
LSQFTGTFFATNFGCGFGSENGVAIDPTSHDIVYSDSTHDQLQIFSSGGTLLSQFGMSGSGDGQFDTPAGIAIDPVSDDVVVADSFNNRVQILSLAGMFLSQFGGSGSCNGRLNTPNAVAVDPTTENIVVTDGDNTVSIFVPTSVPITCVSPAPALSEGSLLGLALLLAMTGVAMIRRTTDH